MKLLRSLEYLVLFIFGFYGSILMWREIALSYFTYPNFEIVSIKADGPGSPGQTIFVENKNIKRRDCPGYFIWYLTDSAQKNFTIRDGALGLNPPSPSPYDFTGTFEIPDLAAVGPAVITLVVTVSCDREAASVARNSTDVLILASPGDSQ